VLFDATFELTTPNEAGGRRVLVHEAQLQLLVGRRYGLTGNNGAGKTMLLRHIHQLVAGDAASRLRVVTIGQTESEALAHQEATPLAHVLAHDEEKRMFDAEEECLMTQLEQFDEDATDTPAFEAVQEALLDVQTRLEAFDASRMEQRATKVLRGLGFSDTDLRTTPCARLSGGWRQRVVLAC
jgi:ATP-binding cassette subfamily F protein 3